MATKPLLLLFLLTGALASSGSLLRDLLPRSHVPTFNPSIHSLSSDDDPFHPPELTVAQYNLAHAFVTEKFDHLRWDARWPRLKRQINRLNASIICVEELRRNLGSTQTPEQAMAEMAQYKFELYYKHSGEMSFANGILWRPEVVYPIDRTSFWLSADSLISSDSWTLPADKARGTIVSCIEFVWLRDYRIVLNARDMSAFSPFWVCVTHFEPFYKPTKLESAKLVARVIAPLARVTNVILAGDFNIFPDTEEELQLNRIITASGDLIDTSNDCSVAVTSQSGTPIRTTFMGFAVDEHFTQTLGAGPAALRPGCLDRIYVSRRWRMQGAMVVHTETMQVPEPAECSVQLCPSDHLPISVKLVLDQVAHTGDAAKSHVACAFEQPDS